MTKLAKRALELVVALFALYAFLFLPLGKKTAFQHLCAILGTDEAQRAGQEFQYAGSRMLDELLHFRASGYRGEPIVPQLPRRVRESIGSQLPEPGELLDGE